MTILPEGIDIKAVQASVEELTSAMLTPLVTGLSIITEYKLGEKDQYLSSVLTVEGIDKLKWGDSVAVFCPTGAGKSRTVEEIALAIAPNKKVIIITNRIVCKEQLIQELCKQAGMTLIPPELLDKISITDNLKIMTYQQFVKECHRYHGKEIVLFLDECHCLAEDATFSVYPQQMLRFLHGNLDNTVRFYITATPEAVIPTIWELEALTNKTLPPLSADNINDFLRTCPVKTETRIQKTYLMKPDWSYLTFKTYDPDNREALIDYLNEFTQNGKKALIYINDVQKGRELQELIGDSQHIYSDEDKKAELHQITENGMFESAALVTTKVAENGLSLYDKDIAVIVAETFDPISSQQIIG